MTIRKRYWKVYLKVHAITTDMSGKPAITRWTSVYNVVANTKDIAEAIVYDDVPDEVHVDNCYAKSCKLSDFKGITDFVQGEPTRKRTTQGAE